MKLETNNLRTRELDERITVTRTKRKGVTAKRRNIKSPRKIRETKKKKRKKKNVNENMMTAIATDHQRGNDVIEASRDHILEIERDHLHHHVTAAGYQ